VRTPGLRMVAEMVTAVEAEKVVVEMEPGV
jgi:hypothetical protein